MQAGLRLSAQGEAESISAGEVNALRIPDGSTQSVFYYGFIEFSIAFYGRVLLDRDEEVMLCKNIK